MPSEKQIQAAAKAMETLALEQGFVPWDEAASVALTAAEQAEPARVKVKPLDKDDYEEIISAAAINMRKATSGIQGQVVTVQDSLDWWVMKETERRILPAPSPAPEAQQKPVARPAEQAVTEAEHE